ncbi:WhiB family transcriptional regulator [Mycobacterium intracellulare]|uniref:WhiB family transcriptional regulator n=1 Tax=Mycobacterium intracellulare TaxID=1767 RepID=UPI0006CA872D|nr:WhiB family transcriptional regulator [Mycobacterium intracellulare]KPN46607.1 transcription factor WhiB [Mycobacterium intracellulare subsp. chimaera]
MTVTLDRPLGPPLPPCLQDPDRWIDSGDDPTLKQLCRACPRRWRCAKEALSTPRIEGMVAGIYLTNDIRLGRARTFALRQLQSLAAHGGYAAQPVIP